MSNNCLNIVITNSKLNYKDYIENKLKIGQYYEVYPFNEINKEQALEIRTDLLIENDEITKIYIFENVKLNKFVANTLLKVTEDYTGKNKLIIITNNINKIIKTIQSRANIFKIDETKEVNEITIEQINDDPVNIIENLKLINEGDLNLEILKSDLNNDNFIYKKIAIVNYLNNANKGVKND